MICKPIYLTIILSCLLHVAFIFIPYSDSRKKIVFHGNEALTLKGVRIIKWRQETRNINLYPIISESSTAVTPPSIAIPEHQTNLEQIEKIDSIETNLNEVNFPPDLKKYYTSSELTKRPQVITMPEFDPIELNKAIINGSIVLKIWLSEFGDVDKIEIESTDLPDFISADAVDIFRKQIFYPGEVNYKSVASILRIEINYNDDTITEP